MAIKKTTKAKAPAKKKPAKNTVRAAPISMDSSVNVRKASNGYVVSQYTRKGEVTYIAKDKAELTRQLAKCGI